MGYIFFSWNAIILIDGKFRLLLDVNDVADVAETKAGNCYRRAGPGRALDFVSRRVLGDHRENNLKVFKKPASPLYFLSTQHSILVYLTPEH